MANDFHKLQWTDEDFTKAAKDWGRQFLLMPVIQAETTLKYMTGMAGVRYKVALPTIEGRGQFAPYRHDRKAADTTDIEFRELETFPGNLSIDFEPMQYIQTILGRGAATLGDGQKSAPTVRHVIAAVMQDAGRALNDCLFTAKRNAAGDTTADLFDGWGTILDRELEEGNVSEAKGNLLTLGDKVTSANAVDVAKEIERSCHPILRRTDKLLFCDPAFADAYNDNYLLTHAGIVYNKQYDQPIVEGSGNKTTIVPLDCLAGTDKYILTPKSNMLYGYDNAGDNTRFEINRFSSWVLTIAAAMFFGTQFYTLDQRFLKDIKLSNL